MPRLFSTLLALTPLAAIASDAPGAWRTSSATPGRYEASLDGWTLAVDSARARLVSLIPPGGSASDNLLLAGGHRVWLGPQNEWPAFWPPPTDWENSAAASATLSADAAELTLLMPRGDPGQPAVLRRYRLLPGALVLVAAWRPEPGSASRQAVQILQTRADAVVRLEPRPTAEAPLGRGLLALAVRPGTNLVAAPPASLAASEPDGALRLVFNGEEEKIGVPPQPIVARYPGGHALRLLPATHDGLVDDTLPAPEAGLFTQAYFGAAAWAMVEIEQLTPRLLPARADGWIESSVRLELVAPPGP